MGIQIICLAANLLTVYSSFRFIHDVLKEPLLLRKMKHWTLLLRLPFAALILFSLVNLIYSCGLSWQMAGFQWAVALTSYSLFHFHCTYIFPLIPNSYESTTREKDDANPKRPL